MRKFTFILLLFVTMVTTAMSAVTDLPTITIDENNPVWYIISNTRSTSGKYLYYGGDNVGLKDSDKITTASFFYFTGSHDELYIHNYATKNKLAGVTSWTNEGSAWAIAETPHSSKAGLAIAPKGGLNGNNCINESNASDGYTTYSANDAGSIFVVELVSSIDIDALQESIKTELSDLSSVGNIYPDAAEAISKIDNISKGETAADYIAAIGAFNSILNEYKVNAYKALNGKYFSVKTPARTNGYMQMSVSSVIGVSSLSNPADIWQFVYDDRGTVGIYNPYNDMYLAEPGNNSTKISVTAKENAGAYHLVVKPDASNSGDAKIMFTSNKKLIHMDAGSNLVRWDDGEASEWTVLEMSAEDMAAVVEAYKSTVRSKLDNIESLSDVALDANIIDAAKDEIENISATDYSAFAAIDNAFLKVIDVVQAATKAELDNLASVSSIYPDATEAISKIDNISKGKTLARYLEVINVSNNILYEYKVNAYKALNGKYFSVKTPARTNGYMQMSVSSVIGVSSLSNPADIWQFVYDDRGTVNIYNPYIDKYLAEPGDYSTKISVTAKENAGAYHLVVKPDASNSGDAKIMFTSNKKSIHMDAGSNLVRWDDGGASEWTVLEMSAEDMAAVVEAYKSVVLCGLEYFVTWSIVTELDSINTAKSGIEGMADTGFSAFAAIDSEFKKVIDEAEIEIDAIQAAVKTELGNLSLVNNIYTNTAEAINKVDNISKGETVAEYLAAINILYGYKVNAYKALNGKYFSVKTPARTNGYMQMSVSSVIGVSSLSNPADIWQFVYDDRGTVGIYNPYNDMYLAEPGNNSTKISVTAKENAGAYHLVVKPDASNSDAKIKFTSNKKSIHMDGSSNLVRWDDGEASEWTVLEMSAEDMAAVVEAYKSAAVSTLDSYAALSGIFDTELINAAKEKIVEIAVTDFSAFAVIDTEFRKVIDDVDTKNFTFQTTATDAGRNSVWISADLEAGKAIGADEHDYNAIWNIKSARGLKLLLYNPLNNVYIGNPEEMCVLSETAMAGYTLEIVNAENNIVEFKCDGQTLHASNRPSNELINWYGNEDASRWYVRTIDVSSYISDLINSLSEDDYAEDPELGQYPMSAYDALVEAKDKVTTVQEVIDAIDTFKASLNLPVFTIDGVIGYASGKSIYDSPGNMNGKGNTLYFKATDKWNTAMLWVLNQNTSTVGVVESVGISNYGTHAGFWNVNTIKITETSDANEGDGIFLFYTTDDNNTPIHAQDNGQLITRWASTESTSGSAWKFVYVGDTYTLERLGDDKFAAMVSLQATKNSLSSLIGTEYGQYSIDNSVVVAAQALLDMSFEEVVSIELATIEAAEKAINDAMLLNTPKAGDYIRIKYNFGDAGEKYVQGVASGVRNKANAPLMNDEQGAASIFYCTGNRLLSYSAGCYIHEYSGTRGLAGIGVDGGVATFEAGGVNGTLAVKLPSYMHANSVQDAGNTVYFVDHCSGSGHPEHNFTVEAVTSLPVTITAAGYASFYAPVAVKVAEGVEAYYALSVDEEWVKLTKIEDGVVPANTGVILKGAADNYEFEITTTEVTIENNLFKGTTAATIVEKEDNAAYYVLGNGGNGVGMYNPVKGEDDTQFINNSHKAYLHIVGAAQSAGYRFDFDFDGTTGISEVDAEVDNAVIYDLTGRRVKKAVNGIYIVNGKKVLVK